MSDQQQTNKNIGVKKAPRHVRELLQDHRLCTSIAGSYSDIESVMMKIQLSLCDIGKDFEEIGSLTKAAKTILDHFAFIRDQGELVIQQRNENEGK